MKGRRVGPGLVLRGFAALLLAGCASEGSMKKAGTGDVVADRQRLMKNVGANWQDIQNKFKAGNIEAIAVNADTLAIDSEHIPAMFPKGSLTEKSKAKPEIWQKWPEFEAAAKNLDTWSTRLRDAAQKKDQAQVEAIMKDFGRQACGTCHTPFRVPPPARS
jgi:cytochrome c556